MKCALCNEQGEFYCPCKNIFFCVLHEKEHNKLCNRAELLNISLADPECQTLKKELEARICQISQSRAQVSLQVKEIMKKIKVLSKAVFNKLDSLSQFYVFLLNSRNLSKSLKL